MKKISDCNMVLTANIEKRVENYDLSKIDRDLLVIWKNGMSLVCRFTGFFLGVLGARYVVSGRRVWSY